MSGHGYDARFDDPYVYKGTSTLKNRLSLRDAGQLESFELEMSTLRAGEALPDGLFDVRHYMAIHRHLFQDVYAWAGRPRTVRTSKGGNSFCYPEHIHSQLDKLFQRVKPLHELAALPTEAYCIWAADFLSDLNAIHVFREGNGRAQLVFLLQLSAAVRHPMVLDRIQPEPFLLAMIESFSGRNALLREQLMRLFDAR